MTAEMNELIVVEQLPVIRQQLIVLSEEMKRMANDALSLPCSKESKQAVKDARSEYTKAFESIERRRIDVKNVVMKPYNEFDALYKELITAVYAPTDAKLKSRIDEIELSEKAEKEAEIKRYYAEYAAKWNIDFVPFERAGLNITLTVSPKKLKERVNEFVDRICDDLALIETQEHKDEILVEYRETLNCSQAITAVLERHKALAEQEARRQEQEQRKAASQADATKVERIVPIAPPNAVAVSVMDSDPIMTLEFKWVKHKKSKLLELREFLRHGGYEYE